jgi:hypothetical protein
MINLPKPGGLEFWTVHYFRPFYLFYAAKTTWCFELRFWPPLLWNRHVYAYPQKCSDFHVGIVHYFLQLGFFSWKFWNFKSSFLNFFKMGYVCPETQTSELLWLFAASSHGADHQQTRSRKTHSVRFRSFPIQNSLKGPRIYTRWQSCLISRTITEA